MHRKTRCVIERSFGVLKMRWKIFDRKVCYGPEKVCKIASTCCVLHNICRRNGTLLPEMEQVNLQNEDDDEVSMRTASGLHQRQCIVEMLP